MFVKSNLEISKVRSCQAGLFFLEMKERLVFCNSLRHLLLFQARWRWSSGSRL